MSRLDDLKYALASAGYSADRIATVEQDVLTIAIHSVRSTEQIAGDVISALSVMQDFQGDMESLLKATPIAHVSFTTMALAMRAFAASDTVPDMPPVSTKPTERTPYYQRSEVPHG